jgi:uncharacterized membrane protein
MLSRLSTIMLILGLLMGVTTGAYAHDNDTKTPGIKRRQHHQQKRIVHGVRSGELTRREASRLRREHREIRQDVREIKSDGDVTRRERIKIHREQNRASRHIYRAKHNKRDRN